MEAADAAGIYIPRLCDHEGLRHQGGCRVCTPTVYLSDISSANCTTTGVGGTWTAATKTRSAQTAPDGTYTNAVWVDLDLACGQCHGGSIGTTTYNGAPYISKTALAAAATGMHIAAGSEPADGQHSSGVAWHGYRDRLDGKLRRHVNLRGRDHAQRKCELG